MGQGECLEFLEKNGKWTTVKEIVEELNQSETTIGNALRRLLRSGDIIRRRDINYNSGRKYEWKLK